MSYISLGGKYSGIVTRLSKNGSTTFYVSYRNSESKVIRKKVGVSPEMTNAKALLVLNDIKEEIRAKKELSENPNSPIPKILQKKVDKKTYTLNDLADYYFYENESKSNRAVQNKYNYHISDQPFANKNIHLLTEEDIEGFIKRKSLQRSDNRRSNSGNVTKLHEKGSLPKRKRKSRAVNLSLEEREQVDYDNNIKEINRLESIIEEYKNQVESTPEDYWREENKIKYLKEINKVLGYRLFPEKARKLKQDKTLTIDQLNALRGILSRKSIKELLLLASTIVNYANRHKRLNIRNEFHILKGDKLYIKNENRKIKYLTKEEIKNYLQEIKIITEKYPETHNYLYLISLLGLSTAARRDTILSIKIEDIDLENNNIKLRNFKTEKNFVSAISSPAIKSEIVRIIDNRPASSFLFENPTTEMKITVFPPKMKEVLDYTVNCNKSYLNFLTIKEFRNTVASHLIMGGTAIAHIAQLLDHASIRTTEIYTQLAPSTAKDDIATFAEDFLSVD
ncbi:MAG: tyrosine-type recombinase/integrase [Sulfurimonas sp.]|nr:tyrosine-type recombinase/integrase [Sulfurimonas sp.]